MAFIYFPGCKYTVHSPENSAGIQKYLHDRFDMQSTECCSVNYKTLTERDTAVYVCTTCRAILLESAPQAKVMSVWEVLMSDDHFPWPNYHGRTVTVQDCWRSRDDRAMQDAIRGILMRMNVNVAELDQSYDTADFCGISLLKPPPPRYQQLAPIRLIQNAGDKFRPHTEAEQAKLMKLHAAQYVTDAVLCYCTGCLEGLNIGGARGIHLMDFLMGTR